MSKELGGKEHLWHGVICEVWVENRRFELGSERCTDVVDGKKLF